MSRNNIEDKNILNGQLQFNFGNLTKVAPSLTKSGSEQTFRPIHYLGSKLRIVDLVRNTVDLVDPSAGPVCDLFAGSGTVSKEFSKFRDVISVDIQEYSRVLCSALLNPSVIKHVDIERFLSLAFSSEHAQRLAWAIQPMVTYETECLHQSVLGNVEPLCELLERASLVSLELDSGYFDHSSLTSSMQQTITRLREVNLLNSSSSIATRYFGGIYFSFAQASNIDMLLEAVSKLPSTEKDTFLAAVMSTTSDVVNTVGKQFAQPIQPRFSDGRPKPNLSKRVFRDRMINVLDTFSTWIARYQDLQHSPRVHKVIRGDFADALDILKGQVSVVYADPPYTRDHYSRYYHVLETLCLRDCPPLSSVRIGKSSRVSRGIYRLDRHQSPFCIKSQARKAFSILFQKVRNLEVPLVLSYSPFDKSTDARPRLMDIKDIVELANQSFDSVEVQSAGSIAHSKLNRSGLNKPVVYDAENFIICKP